MEQKQNIFNQNPQADEKESVTTKKSWETPKLQILPVPSITQGGKRARVAPEGKTTSYRIRS